MFINGINKKIYILISMILVVVVGLITYKDYGLTLDDESYRLNGVFYKEFIQNYFLSIFSFDFSELSNLNKEIQNTSIRNHPAIFEIFLEFIVKIFGVTEINKIYNISHLLNYLIFSSSLFICYKIILVRFNSYLLSILSIFLIFFTPRFFAESFYNSRDIFFFSLFIFFIYTVQCQLEKDDNKNKILVSLTSALLIISKILGIIPFLIYIFFYTIYNSEKNNTFIKIFTKVTLIILFTLLFILLLWPYLWLNPIENLIQGYFGILKEHDNLKVLTLFMGEQQTSTSTPWYFRIVWFYITTPLIICLLFSLGLVVLLTKFIRDIINLNEKNSNLVIDKSNFLDFFLLLNLILIVFVTAKYNDSQFNGWRHLYFLYLPIIYISIFAIRELIIYKRLKIIVFSILTMSCALNAFWIFKNHPYQNNYLNYFASKYAINKFDLDYWGLSNYQSLKYILDKDNRTIINVSTVSFANLNISKLKLDKKNRERLNVVFDYRKADYLINSYMGRLGENYINNFKNYKKFYEITVLGKPINTVYKKN